MYGTVARAAESDGAVTGPVDACPCAGMLRCAPMWCAKGMVHPAGLNDGTFRIFETLTWRSEAWSHVSCGYLVDVAWSTKAQPPALIMCCSGQLASLHFTEEAPSLDAQLMPLSAPQIFEQEVTSSGREPWARGLRAPRTPRRPLDGEEVLPLTLTVLPSVPVFVLATFAMVSVVGCGRYSCVVRARM